MKSILVTTLIFFSTLTSFAQTTTINGDDSVFEQQDYDFNDYRDEYTHSELQTFTFDSSEDKNTRRNEPLVSVVEPASVGDIQIATDEPIDELPRSEINQRTQSEYKASNIAGSIEGAKVSVHLRNKK